MSNSTNDLFEVFPWSANLETGIAIIDEQHRKLVQLLNLLASHVAQRSDDLSLQQVFDELTAYADYHFKTEESIWEPCLQDDTWFSEHKKVHDSFLDRLGELKAEGQTLPTFQVIEDILKFLIGWLAHHILDNDRRMAIAVQAIEEGLTVEQAKQHADEQMSGAARLLIETVLDMYESVSSRTIELLKERTERAELEETLRISEKRERAFSDAIMRAMPGVIALYDNQARLVRWNQRGQEESGYSVAELENKSVLDFFEPEKHQTILEDLRKAREGDVVNVELDMVFKGGERRPYLFSTVAMDQDDKNYFLTSGVDISRLKQTEHELRTSQERYDEAQRIAHLGHWEINHRNTGLIWSDEIFRLLEKDPSEYTASYDGFLEVTHPDDRDLVDQTFRQSVAYRKPYELTHRLLMPDDRVKYINVRGITNYGEDGSPCNSFGTMRDVTRDVLADQALENKNKELEAALMGVVESVANALEVRDPYTSGHQRRVADIAVAIANKMGMDAFCVEGLRLGARIHDIGKLSIPAELLTKPTRLSELEYQLIKSHAETGANILKSVKFPWPIREIVSQHHERIDGSGYPKGLKSDEICLEARIVAVADVFEAMSAHRPYRASLGADMAISELKGHRGTRYDPGVVDTLLELLEEDPERFSERA